MKAQRRADRARARNGSGATIGYSMRGRVPPTTKAAADARGDVGRAERTGQDHGARDAGGQALHAQVQRDVRRSARERCCRAAEAGSHGRDLPGRAGSSRSSQRQPLRGMTVIALAYSGVHVAMLFAAAYLLGRCAPLEWAQRTKTTLSGLALF